MNIHEKAELLIRTFTKGLSDGVRHYRKSDGALLETAESIIRALQAEGEVTIIFPDERSKPREFVNIDLDKEIEEFERSEILEEVLDSEVAVQYRPMEGQEYKN